MVTDSSVKKRIKYAKDMAKRKLEELGHTVINSDNQIICFTATFGNYCERKIRVVINDITDQDIELIKRFNILPSQTKEIWCKKEGGRDFVCIMFDKDNNPVPFYNPVNRKFPH